VQHSSRYPILLLCFVCVCALAASVRNELVWDTKGLVLDSPSTASLCRAGASFLPSRWRSSAESVRESYRPIANVSFAIDNALWRGMPAGYHLSNLAFHVLAVIGLYWVARAALQDFHVPRPAAGAFLSALVLALHPALVEATVWTENRAVVLCTILCLLVYGSLLSFWAGRGAGLTYACALAAYGAALLTQEAAVALPITFALYVLLRPAPEGRWTRLGSTLPFFVLAAAFALLRVSTLRSGVLMVSDTPDIPASHRALAVVRTIGGYLATLVFPIHLSSDRYFIIPRNLGYPGMAGGALALAVWMACFAARTRLWRLVWFGLGSVIAALLPVANIVLMPGRPIADQRLYLPAIGICLVAGGALSCCCHLRRRAACWLLAAVVCAFASLAALRVFDFQNDYVFWRAAARSSPRKGRAMLNLGIQCQGKLWFDRAEKLFRSVIRRYPTRGTAHHRLGQVLLFRGRFEEALGSLQAACQLDSPGPQTFVDAASALHVLQRHDEAMTYIERAKAMKRAPSDAWYLASLILRARGETANADVELKEAKRRLAQEQGTAAGGQLW